ncbi:DsbA family oxidoreductase [Curtobacterium sp. NPDC089689]|uniref:DsbA family oxidoreductase n=1 Tax=Curtobacterium sp. NPDC089689 TaxID=3363968 RepID=UPI00381B2624
MQIEIWSDIACPWCYIGSFRLDEALRQFPHRDNVQLVHRSFELHPGYPLDDTMPVLDMFVQRYGTTREQARTQEGRLQQVAQQEGLPFSIERDFGNTRRAHELVHLADEHGLGHQMMQTLYRTLFSADGTLFTEEGLVSVAVTVGLDAEEVRAALQSGRYREAVTADEARAHELGISGVPFFLIDGKYALSGGQKVSAFVDVLNQVWEAEEHVPDPAV